jgi:hypothetical protein
LGVKERIELVHKSQRESRIMHGDFINPCLMLKIFKGDIRAIYPQATNHPNFKALPFLLCNKHINGTYYD